MSKEKYRFCIGRKSKHSSLFTIIVQNNDVYVVSSSKNNDLKLSIHESGVGQSSYTSEFIKRADIEMKNADRHIMKMKLMPLSKWYEIVTSFVFPNKQIVLNDIIEKQNVKWIDLPSVNEFVEVAFCRARTINFALDLCTSEWRAVKTITLQDNTLFLVLYRYAPMRVVDYETMYEGEQKLRLYKKENNIEEMIAATIHYHDDDNRRYEMEVFL